jgi:hypothetical protein
MSKKLCPVCGREIKKGTGCITQKHLVHKKCKSLMESNWWRYV